MLDWREPAKTKTAIDTATPDVSFVPRSFNGSLCWDVFRIVDGLSIRYATIYSDPFLIQIGGDLDDNGFGTTVPIDLLRTICKFVTEKEQSRVLAGSDTR
jgi:hypothetical protein